MLNILRVRIAEGSKGNFIERVSKLISINHNLLCALGVSHPELEKVVQISRQFGFSCKLTGAGGGGCAIILNDAGNGSEEIQQLSEALR